MRLISSQESAECSIPSCTQPQCPLRRVHFNRTRLAQLLVQAVTRRTDSFLPDEGGLIEPQAHCAACAARVIRGQRPFPTSGERDRIANEL